MTPTPNLSNMVYDTTTGDPRPLTTKDHVNRTSMEVAFYAMQTVRIRNQDILMFYDSGSNSHLIEGMCWLVSAFQWEHLEVKPPGQSLEPTL